MGKPTLNFHYPSPKKEGDHINIIESNTENKRKIPTRDEIVQILQKRNQDYKIISLFDDLRFDNQVLIEKL